MMMIMMMMTVIITMLYAAVFAPKTAISWEFQSELKSI